MPSVPMLNRPQVAPNVRRAIDVPVASTGAGAAAMGLSVAADAFQKERERAGQIRANAAEAEIRQVSSRLATEVERMQRTQALGAEDFVAEKWGTEVSRITAGISDPAVRQAVEARANVLRGELTSRARTHASREMERADTEDYERNQKDDLARLASTPLPDADAIIERMRLRTTERLTNQGFSPEAKQAEVERMVSAARFAQVNALVTTDQPDVAERFLQREDVMGTMRPDDYAKAQKLVKGEGIAVRSQRARDRLVRDFTTEAEAVKAARDEFEGEMEDAVVRRVQIYFAEQDTARADETKVMTDNARRGILDGSGIPQASRIYLREYDPKTLGELEQYQVTKARGEDPETNWDTYTTLINEYADSPTKFARQDFSRYINQLSPRHYEEMIKLAAGMRGGQTPRMSPVAVNAFVWEQARKNGVVPSDVMGGADLKKKNSETNARFTQFQAAITGALATALADNPRLTVEEQMAIMQGVVDQQAILRRTFLGADTGGRDTIPAAAVRPGDKVVMTIGAPAIPLTPRTDSLPPLPPDIYTRELSPKAAARAREIKAQYPNITHEQGIRMLQAEGLLTPES